MQRSMMLKTVRPAAMRREPTLQKLQTTVAIQGKSGPERTLGMMFFAALRIHRSSLLCVGSRLIDRQSQNMTVAAKATAERNVLAHLS